MSGLLRICTAGSVDDGKSTLIGRLLYDSKGVYEDQISSVEKASKNRTAGPIDFSLFTDGLRAEREQGITIDVAYRYFATARRKFILADTPGHEQYTRNMATGASTADVAILLVDARHGVLDQSRRHARIARLLGIKHFAVAVNKMDLVDFDRDIFEGISAEFSTLLAGAAMYPIPMSALEGDNVITRSARTPWFDGPSLLEYLETVEVARDAADRPLRFPVQLVLRPDQDFRGYAGQILSGTVRVGDPITAWPSVRSSKVRRIVTWDGDLDIAFAPMSVTLVLEDELDISRGDIITNTHIEFGKRFVADLVWMDERPLEPNRLYVLKHASGTTTAQVDTRLLLNDIGRVTIESSRALIYDRYGDERGTGCFILIEPTTNFTAGAGMIAEPRLDQAPDHHPGAAERIARVARMAHSEGEAIEAVRRALEELLT
jgi:sulfate adenylyltransferase subunit 1